MLAKTEVNDPIAKEKNSTPNINKNMHIILNSLFYKFTSL